MILSTLLFWDLNFSVVIVEGFYFQWIGLKLERSFRLEQYQKMESR